MKPVMHMVLLLVLISAQPSMTSSSTTPSSTTSEFESTTLSTTTADLSTTTLSSTNLPTTTLQTTTLPTTTFSTTTLPTTTQSTTTLRTTTLPTTTTSADVIQPPNITYTCDGAGTFVLNMSEASPFSHFVVTHNTTINGPMYNETNLDNCTRKLTDMRDLKNKTIHLTNCGDYVYLYTMNHSTSLSKVVGGASFHKYNLQCKLPEEGVTFSVGVSFENTQPDEHERNKIPDLNLTMQFMDEDSNIQSIFKIGDEFQLNIHDYSAVEHKLKLKSCKSYSDEEYSDDELDLYDSDEGVWETDIFGDINDDSTRDITIEIHAFRYPTSSTVYIQCLVYVCNKQDAATCGVSTNKKRRRRSTDNTVHPVKGSFVVIETIETIEPKTSGQCAVAPWSIAVLSSFPFVSAYLSMK